MGIDLRQIEKDVPALSSTAALALSAINQPSISNTELEEIIRHDPGLTQRVLRMANAPFYKGAMTPQTIRAAILRLGHRQLKNLIAAAAIGDLFDDRDPIVRALWDHSIAAALASLKIAETFDFVNAEETFTAGLLHDIGKMILLHLHPDEYRSLLEQARESRQRLHLIESEVFGHVDHATVGGMALQKWGLTLGFVEAALYHHEAETELLVGQTCPRMVNIVSLASVIANHLDYGIPAYSWPETFELQCARQLGFMADQLDEFKVAIADCFEATRAAFA